MQNLDYKNKNIERKYFKNMQNNQFLKVKNSLLALEQDFKILKDKKLKDRKDKIKREIEKLFNPIIVSKEDLDRFEEQEMKKIRPIKKMI